MGIEPYLMERNLIAIIAQRLTRKLCNHCKKERPITDFEKKILGQRYSHIKKLFTHNGCRKCNHVGYKGRISICEILPFDKELDNLIATSATRKEIYNYVTKVGFVTMQEDGLGKVAAGIVDLKELIKSVDLTDRMNLE